MPAPHAFYSKMLAERTASRIVFVLFYLFIYSSILRRIMSSSSSASSPPTAASSNHTASVRELRHPRKDQIQ
jgi:hypothetical protein